MNAHDWRKLAVSMGAAVKRGMESGVSREEAMHRVMTIYYESFAEANTGIGEDGKKLITAVMQTLPSAGLAWAENAFSVLAPSHKLAASLICTKIPPETVSNVELPWRCFGIDVPAGIFDDEPAFFLVLNSRDGKLRCLTFDGGGFGFDIEDGLAGYAEREIMSTDIPDSWKEEYSEQGLRELSQSETRRVLARGRLIVGLCIESERLRQQTNHGDKNKTAIKIKRGEPRPWVYRVTRDVRLDLRSEVRNYLVGIRSAPSIQVLVRGHWKWQPHGTGHAMRKWIHVEPYWRGPEDAPIAVRSHVL